MQLEPGASGKCVISCATEIAERAQTGRRNRKKRVHAPGKLQVPQKRTLFQISWLQLGHQVARQSHEQ